jgi:N-acetylglucosamine-6-sulfatase
MGAEFLPSTPSIYAEVIGVRKTVLVLSSSMALAVVLCLALVLFTGAYTHSEPSAEAQASPKPNIIFILTDDLDAKPESISHMPNLRRYLINQGATFDNAFATTSLCCPSRATILRGQYSHNHGILTNEAPLGGAQRFRELGRENSTIATWLHGGGYRTVEIGKYLNGYQPPKPPGWDVWYGGGSDGGYPTDNYASEAAQFIRGMKGKSQPFFMWLGTHAPHEPATPPPRYADRFTSATAPRPPSFNEADVSDKPEWIRQKNPLTSSEIDYIDNLYRNRLRSMLAVDDLIGRVVESLQYSRKLSNTYIVFTSDNGWVMGEHRRFRGKWSAYEEDIRVPLIVRGPGVPLGTKRSHMVLNNDFAPTFAQLGRASVPSFVDGRSIVPLLRSGPPSPSNWRSAFLEEAVAYEEGFRPAFKAVRTRGYLWVEYANGERELYNVSEDPYELQSLHQTAPADLKQFLSSRLDSLRVCAREGCRTAEGF